MRKQLYYHLSTDATIAGLVLTRIFPAIVKTGTALPYIDYQFNGQENEKQQDGYTNYIKDFVDINSCATTIAGCEALSTAVFNRMNQINGFIGEVGSTQFVHNITLQSESDDFFLNDGSENAVYEITQTYEINYNK